MPSPDALRAHVFLSCGDASGERYGARLVAELRRRAPGLRFSALGGEALAAAGVEIVQPADALALMGFTDLLGAAGSILAARRRLRRHLARGGVDLFLPVDFPGFNLALAGHARRLGIPVCWLIAPQLWAWGSWRLGRLRRSVDCLGTILPFEPDFFGRHGLPVRHLGHPLVGEYPAAKIAVAAAARERRLRDPAAPLRIGLLPGSRRQEAAALWPVLERLVQLLREGWPSRRVAFLASVTPRTAGIVTPGARRCGVETTTLPLPELLPDLDLAVVCSGTASLEAALAAVPHVVVYRTGRVNYRLARLLVRTRFIALANLVLERRAVPERIQGAATPQRLAADLDLWAGDAVRRRRWAEDVARLRRRLGGEEFWARAAAAVLETLARVRRERGDG